MIGSPFGSSFVGEQVPPRSARPQMGRGAALGVNCTLEKRSAAKRLGKSVKMILTL
jgi:hypothetical protein